MSKRHRKQQERREKGQKAKKQDTKPRQGNKPRRARKSKREKRVHVNKYAGKIGQLKEKDGRGVSDDREPIITPEAYSADGAVRSRAAPERIVTPEDLAYRIKTVGPRNSYHGEKAELVFHHGLQGLVVGSYTDRDDAMRLRKKISVRLGSLTEHRTISTLDLFLAHNMSENDVEGIRRMLRLPDDRVVTGFSYVDLRKGFQLFGKNGVKLMDAIKYHMARLRLGYFEDELRLDMDLSRKCGPEPMDEGRAFFESLFGPGSTSGSTY